jgi:hypothetical protein
MYIEAFKYCFIKVQVLAQSIKLHQVNHELFNFPGIVLIVYYLEFICVVQIKLIIERRPSLLIFFSCFIYVFGHREGLVTSVLFVPCGGCKMSPRTFNQWYIKIINNYIFDPWRSFSTTFLLCIHVMWYF